MLTEKYHTCLDSFKNCSYDNENQTYLISSEQQVLNFDKLKNLSFKGMASIKSCDALWICDGKYYLIEFKNSPLENSQSEKNNVKDSFLHSLLILLDELNQTIAVLKEQLVFILVYNPCKQNPNKEYLQSKTSHQLPVWLLNCHFDEKFCSDVLAFNPQQFTQWLEQAR
jgi:hypothetical protein